MKVTGNVHNELAAIRRERHAATLRHALVQRRLASGEWSQPIRFAGFRGETPEQILARIRELNPRNEYRMVLP